MPVEYRAGTPYEPARYSPMNPTMHGDSSGGGETPQKKVESAECSECHSLRTVPVLHRRVMNQPTGGNPYRLYCLDCNAFLKVTSKEFFTKHLRPHVLPKNQPVDDSDSVIPMHEWDADEFEEVAKRSAELAERDEHDERPYKSTDANLFKCPECGEYQIGKPERCDSCGAVYDW